MTEQFPQPEPTNPPLYPAPPYPYAPLPSPKRRIHPALWAVPAIVLALFIGAAGGASANSKPTAAPVPAPTVTQTQTQTITQTPSACISALSKADAVMGDYYNVVKTVSPVLSAIQAGDVAGVQEGTNEVQRLNPILQSDLATYRSYESQCKTD